MAIWKCFSIIILAAPLLTDACGNSAQGKALTTYLRNNLNDELSLGDSLAMSDREETGWIVEAFQGNLKGVNQLNVVKIKSSNEKELSFLIKFDRLECEYKNVRSFHGNPYHPDATGIWRSVRTKNSIFVHLDLTDDCKVSGVDVEVNSLDGFEISLDNITPIEKILPKFKSAIDHVISEKIKEELKGLLKDVSLKDKGILTCSD